MKIPTLTLNTQWLFSFVGMLLVAVALLVVQFAPAYAQSPQSNSVGIEGIVPTEPPTQAPTISLPGNGQSFANNPIVVRGICFDDLEVRLYKNGIFAGATECANGSYEIEIDIFSGANELIARQYDSLNQASPDSNAVNVTFSNPTADDGFEQLILSSNFSSRGANPGETLLWPLAISGGLGPYALSVDWGDGTVVPVSLNAAGQFEIEHIFSEPGVYKVVVRATDSRGKTAFIQLIAVANGPLETSSNVAESGVGLGDDGQPLVAQSQNRNFIVWPVYFLLFFVVSTFWIGRRYERRRIKELLYSRQSVNF